MRLDEAFVDAANQIISPDDSMFQIKYIQPLCGGCITYLPIGVSDDARRPFLHPPVREQPDAKGLDGYRIRGILPHYDLEIH